MQRPAWENTSREHRKMKSRLELGGSTSRWGLFLVRSIRLLPLFLIFAGATFGQGFNTALVYVGASVPQWGSNPDMGAQINTAYASCPNTGCTIVVVPKSGGTCYD